MLKRDEIIKKLKASLDRERFQHSLRVEKIALKLGEKWGVSHNQLSLAALLHDCGRRYNRRQLLAKAKELGFKIDPIRQLEPKLFHAEISAFLAKKDFGVKTPRVLMAIKSHTVGRPNMTKLEKIIFLADHLEEGRHFKGVETMRRLAFKELDQAVLATTTNMLIYLIEQNLPIFPGTIITRNSYLNNNEKF